MPYEIDETHDPNLESWIESANDPQTDFPLQNLPLGVMTMREQFDGEDVEVFAACTRVGDKIVNLHRLAFTELIDDEDEAWAALVVGDVTLDPDARGRVRRRLQQLLAEGNDELRAHADVDAIVLDADSVSLIEPVEVGDYTDFYASVYHATSVGSMFRPDNPLLPNYKHVPIGYHGRASTIVPSGTPVRRPVGQTAPAEEGGSPGFGPCKLFDYELEVGAVVARGNEIGDPIALADAEDHLLGLCLVNDWSARDLQKWEYQPLGPFLAKSFATSVGSWVVTMEALAPFRCQAFERPSGDPTPLPYLTHERDKASGGFDITLEVYLASAQMREQGIEPVRLSRGSFRDMYWTLAQMLAHHASNGCAMRAGDLLASGTVSGKTRDARGCLLERTWDGDPFAEPPVAVPGTQRTPIELPTGETRLFLADGDEVVIRGFCEREGYRRIGFGECRGVVLPARSI